MWTTHVWEKVMLPQWMGRQVSDVCVCQLGSGSASGGIGGEKFVREDGARLGVEVKGGGGGGCWCGCREVDLGDGGEEVLISFSVGATPLIPRSLPYR